MGLVGLDFSCCATAELAESPKSKDKVTWKGRMVRHFRRHGSASSTHGDAKVNEVPGTFGVPLELCVSSTFSPVCCADFKSVDWWYDFSEFVSIFVAS